jgi:hypothetical protein
MSHYSADKDLNKEVKKLVKDGWIPEMRSKGHWQIRSPGGTVLTISGSVGDFRTIIKFKSDVKRVLKNETKMLQSGL